jgi:hypothetical protein
VERGDPRGEKNKNKNIKGKKYLNTLAAERQVRDFLIGACNKKQQKKNVFR